MNAPPLSRKAVASVICGFAGLTIAGFVGSIAAIILGRAARREISREGLRGDRAARVGIVLGVVGLVAVALVLAVFFAQGAP